MTPSQDALAISYTILVMVCLPAFSRVCSITIPALQNGGVLPPAVLESAFFMAMIGGGGLVLSILIVALGAFIDGGFME